MGKQKHIAKMHAENATASLSKAQDAATRQAVRIASIQDKLRNAAPSSAAFEQFNDTIMLETMLSKLGLAIATVSPPISAGAEFATWFYIYKFGALPAPSLDATACIVAAIAPLREKLERAMAAGRIDIGENLRQRLLLPTKHTALFLHQIFIVAPDYLDNWVCVESTAPLRLFPFNDALAFTGQPTPNRNALQKVDVGAVERTYKQLLAAPPHVYDDATTDAAAVGVGQLLRHGADVLDINVDILRCACAENAVAAVELQQSPWMTQANLRIRTRYTAAAGAKMLRDVAEPPAVAWSGRKVGGKGEAPTIPFADDATDREKQVPATLASDAVGRLAYRLAHQALGNVRFTTLPGGEDAFTADWTWDQDSIRDNFLMCNDVARGRMMEATHVRADGRGEWVDIATLTLEPIAPGDAPDFVRAQVTKTERKDFYRLRGYGDNAFMALDKTMPLTPEANVVLAQIVATSPPGAPLVAICNDDWNSTTIFIMTGLTVVRSYVVGNTSFARYVNGDIGCSVACFLMRSAIPDVDTGVFDSLRFAYVPQMFMAQGDGSPRDWRAFWELMFVSNSAQDWLAFADLYDTLEALLTPTFAMVTLCMLSGTARKLNVVGNHFLKKMATVLAAYGDRPATHYHNVVVHVGSGNFGARVHGLAERINHFAGASNRFAEHLIDALSNTAIIYARMVRRYIACMGAHTLGMIVLPDTDAGLDERIAVDPIFRNLPDDVSHADRRAFCLEASAGLPHNAEFVVSLRNGEDAPLLYEGRPIYMQALCKGACFFKTACGCQIFASHTEMRVFFGLAPRNKSRFMTRAQMWADMAAHGHQEVADPPTAAIVDLMGGEGYKSVAHGAGRSQAKTKTAREVSYAQSLEFLRATGVGRIAPNTQQNHPIVGYKAAADAAEDEADPRVLVVRFPRTLETSDYQQEFNAAKDFEFIQFMFRTWFPHLPVPPRAVHATDWPATNFKAVDVPFGIPEFVPNDPEEFFERVDWPSVRLLAVYILRTSERRLGIRANAVSLWDALKRQHDAIIAARLFASNSGEGVPSEQWASGHLERVRAGQALLTATE